jgi:hypothetical protein
MARASLSDPFTPKPRNDAYTVLLTISLLAMIAACVFLFYDLKRYPTRQPTAQDRALPVRVAAPAPPPGPGPAQPTDPDPGPGPAPGPPGPVQ